MVVVALMVILKESVEMYNYYMSIPTGLIPALMTYLCEKFKIPKRADGSTI